MRKHQGGFFVNCMTTAPNTHIQTDLAAVKSLLLYLSGYMEANCDINTCALSEIGGRYLQAS